MDDCSLGIDLELSFGFEPFDCIGRDSLIETTLFDINFDQTDGSTDSLSPCCPYQALGKDSDDSSSTCAVLASLVPTDTGRAKRKKKVKPSYYKPVHGFRLVYQTDIRRQIPLMFINLRNRQDPLLYRNFLAHFKSKNCLFVTQYPNTTNALFPIITSTMDFNQIVNQYAYRAVTCPDVITKLLSCELRRCKTSPGSEIVIRSHSAGTKLYELPVALQQAPAQALPLDMDALHRMAIPLQAPVRFMQLMEVTFALDANHSVYRIEGRCLENQYLSAAK